MWKAASTYLDVIISNWTAQAALYVSAAVAGLIGALYFVVAGHAWLAMEFSPPLAGLIVGGVFLVIAIALFAVAKVRAVGTSRRRVARLALAASAGTLAARQTVGLTMVASSLVRPALGAAGAGLLLAGRMLLRPNREIRRPMGRDLERDPLSTPESFAALRQAVGRSTHDLTRDLRDQWRQFEPELRENALRLKTELPRRVEPWLSAAATLLPRNQSSWRLWGRPPSTWDRLVDTLPTSGRRWTSVASVVGLAALAVWIARGDRT